MNRTVNAIASRLSLRSPQQASLRILDHVSKLVNFRERPDVADVLEILRNEFPSLTDFEREFPSLCFSLATGVGKTRLMGAFISYLYLEHGIKNFFVLAPNLTIYNKLITDFTPNTPKYVFKGIAEFAQQAPLIITGDNYESSARTLFDMLVDCRINIFNISKINSEVRGGKAPRIKRLSEYLGDSYFEYLAALPDLVLLMDESHRYRASAGIRAINELNPILGLELTATPYLETNRGAVPFKNIVYDYPLSQAMADGFVKEPAVITRKNFNPAGLTAQEIERIKLEDGIRLHESVKVELETYARNTNQTIVKPFMLVIARDTTHASELIELLHSDEFFEGRYKDKAIQVDSSKTGAAEEEMIERLLRVEHANEPTEIVIHVNMLKEGWDVTNLYTIVPLRAANARILIEQSIGRGLRLPYGKRTGVTAVDRLNIVAHDRFQDIIDEANRPESVIRITSVVLDEHTLKQQTTTVVSQSTIANALGVTNTNASPATSFPSTITTPLFSKPEEQAIAQKTYEYIRHLEQKNELVPTIEYLKQPEVIANITQAVSKQLQSDQLSLEGFAPTINIPQIIEQTVELITQQTIGIPRILVLPKGETKSGYHAFTLDLSILKYPVPDEDLWAQHLRTGQRDMITMGAAAVQEQRLEDYIVSGLIDFSDIAYEHHADLLYDLANQTVNHFLNYLDRADTIKILRVYQKQIARFIHSQMQHHYWEDASDYEVVVSKGFSELKSSAYTQSIHESPVDYKISPSDKSHMPRYLFTGFSRCLYPIQKFDSDAERRLAVILDRDTNKWFRPVSGQFQIYYKDGIDQHEYQPDFVAETSDTIYLLEVKARNEMDDPIVLAKRDAALEWAKHATNHALQHGSKPWQYLLIPHDEIAENMTIDGLAKLHKC